jgi:hypothetical protein
MDIKSLQTVNENEKLILFRRLEYLSEKLFGIRVRVIESNKQCSYAEFSTKSVAMKMGNVEEYAEFHSNMFIENIDVEDKEFVKNLPRFLLVFLHELSHLITINSLEQYQMLYMIWNLEYPPTENGWIAHREFPYEKLADNCAVKILKDNYKDIVDIITGKKVRVMWSMEKLQNNRNTIRELAKKYLTEKEFKKYSKEKVLFKSEED